MSLCATAFDETLATAARKLLSCRTAGGHWEGRLASSALSTATAAFALSLCSSKVDGEAGRACERLSRNGIRWLIEHQNQDGGWGDTILSLSNISTTALCWAALSVGGDEAGGARTAAEGWLTKAAGGLGPDMLADAIARRYGKDRTFSVPILTMCALAGRLGRGAEAWQRVPQLPFELAACPHQWFKWLRLPVVSYALPALIAIGQVRHSQRPTRNPATRLLRHFAQDRTLSVLKQIQPEGGGFLEATPLTSFVVMSLVGSGRADHPVVRDGIHFLIRSAQDDGSWPIDTNLATWVTTLSVNALSNDPACAALLSSDDRQRICDWLLKQQYRTEHPYTHAAPGGWAWTDLPGGVPDADDTAGALLALHHLGCTDQRVLEAACAGVRWLLDLQNRDGGMPTFCRGWGALPFDRSGQDLTAHAILAWITWRDRLPAALAARVESAVEAAVCYLARQQRPDGTWVPLWFGNQFAPDDENPTYGTARVMLALAALDRDRFPAAAGMCGRASRWLAANQNDDGGWGGAGGVISSIEETSLALHALAAMPVASSDPAVSQCLQRGAAWLIDRTENGRHFPASPIGFYFAKLWYFEELYPLIFATAALARVRAVLPGLQ